MQAFILSFSPAIFILFVAATSAVHSNCRLPCSVGGICSDGGLRVSSFLDPDCTDDLDFIVKLRLPASPVSHIVGA